MNAWSLPQTAEIGGITYRINADFRDILEIIKYFNDRSRPEYLRWEIAISLFFDGDLPKKDYTEAMRYLSDFVSCGQQSQKPQPVLLDWDKDAKLIIADVNNVAGKEIRAEPFVHWWTFLSYFNAIGEGQLATVVAIRSKIKRHKPLEKWEKEYYENYKDMIDLKTQTEYTAQELEFYAAWGGIPSKGKGEAD